MTKREEVEAAVRAKIGDEKWAIVEQMVKMEFAQFVNVGYMNAADTVAHRFLGNEVEGIEVNDDMDDYMHFICFTVARCLIDDELRSRAKGLKIDYINPDGNVETYGDGSGAVLISMDGVGRMDCEDD